MINLENWLTSGGRHKDRKSSPEATAQVKADAVLLCALVTLFLNEIGWNGSRDIVSGFRTSAANAATPGAAAKSGHMSGHAVDLEDDKDQQILWKICAAHSDTLRKYNLFLEAKEATIGWVHIDNVVRADRPSRIFIP